jgi:hypothetical protein
VKTGVAAMKRTLMKMSILLSVMLFAFAGCKTTAEEVVEEPAPPVEVEVPEVPPAEPAPEPEPAPAPAPAPEPAPEPAPVPEKEPYTTRTQVGYLTKDVSTSEALFGDSAFVDTIHDAQLMITGADVSFASAPIVGYKLSKGPIYVEDILAAQQMFGVKSGGPWLYVAKMSGREIDKYLEYSASLWAKNKDKILAGDVAGLDYYNWDSAAGINYVVNIAKPAGDRVEITSMADGSKFDANKMYSVVLNAFRANDMGGYLTKGLGVTPKAASSRVEKIITVNLEKGFAAGPQMLGTITPKLNRNWSVISEAPKSVAKAEPKKEEAPAEEKPKPAPAVEEKKEPAVPGDRVVGYLAETIETSEALFSDSVLVDTIHQAQLDFTGADISFASAPVVSIDLLKGPVYVRDIRYAQESFGIQSGVPWFYVVEMTGEEIDAYLEHSYGMWYKEMKSINDGLLKGDAYYNWDTAAGIHYVVDVRKPAGNKVNIKTNADGSKFKRDATYTVVLNALRANDVGGYISEGLGMSMKEAQSRVKNVITIDLEKGYEMGERMLGTIEPVYDENWFASPIIWAQRGMEADMERMK